MNYKKDTHGYSQKGQSVQARTPSQNALAPFNDEVRYMTALKKTEKLTTALYMVTDILSDKEPMRWKLRSEGLELLTDISLASTLGASERLVAVRRIVDRIDEVVAMLDIAGTSNLVSDMNASILKEEYETMKELLVVRSDVKVPMNMVSLSREFFHVPQAEQDKLRESVREGYHAFETEQVQKDTERRDAQEYRGTSKGHIERQKEPKRTAVADDQKDMRTTPQRQERQELMKRPEQTLAQVKDKPASITPRKVSDGTTRAAVKQQGRRATILNLLKESDLLSVRDIARVITDCSEKTIQRELLAMVDEGVLKKRGERRWSRYSLA